MPCRSTPPCTTASGLVAAAMPQRQYCCRLFRSQRRYRTFLDLPGPCARARACEAPLPSPEEIESAAAYFSALPYKSWIRVVEADFVPRTEVAGVSLLAPIVDGGTEPIGDRIIEVPEVPSLTRLRDDAQGFVAYAPLGSITKGAELVHSVIKGNRIPCDTCHGPDLRGAELAPPLAGQSPGYLFRQLFDIRTRCVSGELAAVTCC
jgi:hypothetical protein